MTDTTSPSNAQDSTTEGVVIPAEVYAQIMCIRDFGECNMTDRRCVQQSANRHDFYAAVVWLEMNVHAYGVGCLTGFVPDRPLTEDEQATIADAGGPS